MLRFAAFGLASMLLTLPAVAADKCADAQDQATMTKCAGEDFLSEDRKLNENFRKIQKRLAGDAERKALLIAAQRAWIGFRDAECDFSASAAAGGSIYPMLSASCKAEMTKQRNDQLRQYLSCDEGDTTCPMPGAN